MSSKRGRSKKIPIPSTRAIARGIPWYLVAIVLAVLVSSVYWQVGGHDFINIDDDQYVSENPQVLKGLTQESISWAFTTFHSDNWYPLAWLSYMVDIELFGLDAGWHHRVNAMLHLANTVLLFLVLWRMTGGMWPSAFVAALFGVHPLHVESVAWVAERKDVLSTLFWMLTMGAYLRYARRPSVGRYLLVAVLFALGLMAKPMLVTLPFVLLLLDWWPLGRLAQADPSVPPSRRRAVAMLLRLVWEKLPLLGLSAASSAITYLSQAMSGTTSVIEHLTFDVRIANAFVSYVIYLWKAVWPSSLAVYYPHPASIHASIPPWEIAGSIVLLCGLTILALRQRRGRPYLAVGWLWYLGTLVPVIGLIQTGAHARADRFTYIPLIGIFIVIAWGIPAVISGWRFRRLALAVGGGAVVLALSVAAWQQVGYWRDSLTLLSRTVAVTEKNWLALNNLGDTYYRLGRPQQAMGYFQEAVQIKSDYVDAWSNLGVSSQALGQDQQAIGYFQEALRIKPDYAEAWSNLGESYFRLGQPQQAIGYLQEAVRIKPGHVAAWSNLGNSYFQLGQYEEAVRSYRESSRIKPDDADTWNMLGVSYGMLGQYQQAIGCFREALRIKPDHARARDNLAMASGKLGQSRQR